MLEQQPPDHGDALGGEWENKAELRQAESVQTATRTGDFFQLKMQTNVPCSDRPAMRFLRNLGKQPSVRAHNCQLTTT